MTESTASTITGARSHGMIWKDIYDSFFSDTYKSHDAMRLDYMRYTGKYEDTRKRHDQRKSIDDCTVEEWDKASDAVRKKETREATREEVTKNTDGTRTSEITTTTPLDLNDDRAILLFHHYDPEKWEVAWSKSAKWDAIPKHGEEAETFYSSKVTVRPTNNVRPESISEMLRDAKPIAMPIVKTPTGRRVLELSLADIHIGRLAWHGSAGADYDTKIAVERVRKVMGRVVERIGNERFGTIIVPVGGDLMNQEATGATTGGTPQDVDSRFPRVFRDTMYLMASIIEEMRHHADKVQAIHINGNHDSNSSASLAYAMEAWFRNCPDVEVDCSAIKRKYLTFGECLLVLGHFADERTMLPHIIPSEGAEKWGKAKYREAHGQHLHKESVIDYPGFTLRRSPSIVSNDEWSHSKGYGCLQRHTTYIWEPDRGLDTVWYDGV